MPQPLSNKCPGGATVTLWPPPNQLLLASAAHIIAVSAQIDHELSLLLVHILGAQARPALAMFDAFDSQRQQLRLLSVAAEAALGSNTEGHRVFKAVMKTADAAQSDRHKLAHWLWGHCPELPTALLLANPQKIRSRDIERTRLLEKRDNTLAYLLSTDKAIAEQEGEALLQLYATDPDHVLVYEFDDLKRCILALGEALMALHYFRYYLAPVKINALAEPTDTLLDLQTSAGALRRLNSLHLFRQVFDPGKDSSDQSSTPPSQT